MPQKTDNTIYPARSGLSMFWVNLALLAIGVLFLGVGEFPPLGWAAIVLALLMIRGYKVVEEGKGLSLLLFGKYQGYLPEAGFYWVHPLFKSSAYHRRSQYSQIENIRLTDSQGLSLFVTLHAVWAIVDPSKTVGECTSLPYKVELSLQASASYILGNMSYLDGAKTSTQELLIKGNKELVERRVWENLRQRILPLGIELQEIVLTSCQPVDSWVEKQYLEAKQRKEKAVQAVPMAQYILKQWKSSTDMPKLGGEDEKQLLSELVKSLSK